MSSYGDVLQRIRRSWQTPAQARLPVAQGFLLLVASALVGHLLLAWWSGARAGAPLVAPIVREQPVVVHVSGEVPRPGLYQLAGGARVADAINAAGGPGPDADLSGINLARLLEDGEQLRVPGPAPPRTATLVATGTPHVATVDLNRASAAELEQLPGIGPVLAARIVNYREQHGSFQTVRDLRRVQGIGERLFKTLAALVHV